MHTCTHAPARIRLLFLDVLLFDSDTHGICVSSRFFLLWTQLASLKKELLSSSWLSWIQKTVGWQTYVHVDNRYVMRPHDCHQSWCCLCAYSLYCHCIIFILFSTFLAKVAIPSYLSIPQTWCKRLIPVMKISLGIKTKIKLCRCGNELVRSFLLATYTRLLRSNFHLVRIHTDTFTLHLTTTFFNCGNVP